MFGARLSSRMVLRQQGAVPLVIGNTNIKSQRRLELMKYYYPGQGPLRNQRLATPTMFRTHTATINGCEPALVCAA